MLYRKFSETFNIIATLLKVLYIYYYPSIS